MNTDNINAWFLAIASATGTGVYFLANGTDNARIGAGLLSGVGTVLLLHLVKWFTDCL